MSTNEPIPTDDLTVDEAVERLVNVRAEKAMIAAEEKDLIKVIATDRAGGKYVTSNGTEFRITIPQTLDKKALEQAYPYDAAEANRSLYRTELDTTAVKDAIPKNALQQFYKPGNPQVRI
jgi:hypothetical protein